MSVFKRVAWTGTAKSEAYSGNTDADTLNGMGGADTLKGLAGGDDLYGGNGRDVLYGGAGDDFIGGDKGGDRLFGGTGSDRIYVSGLDTATGGAGADQFVILDPGNGGGDKSDLGTVIIRDFDAVGADKDLLDLGVFGYNSGVRWQQRDKGLDDNFEIVRQGDDTILRLKGETGTIVTVVIEDVLPGQLTEDHFFFVTEKQRSAFESANWTGTAKSEKKSGGVDGDSFDGKGGSDTLYGNGGQDNLRGGTGNDKLFGGAARDYLMGDKGADTLFGGGGNDRIYLSGGDVGVGGGGVDDFVVTDVDLGSPEFLDKGVLTVRDFATTGPAQDHLEMGAFGFRGVRWQHRDKGMEDGFEMFANGSDVVLRLECEEGTIIKVVLEDTKIGELKSDHFVFVFPSKAAESASRAESANWTGTAKAESKTGTAKADFFDGKGGNDTLKGMDGNDNLRGGKGADVVFGGAGSDRLYVSGGDTATGGSGADYFILWNAGMQPEVADPGVCVVRDFQTDGAKHDKVELTMFSGITWAHRDKGLDDGFEIVAQGSDTLIRLKGANGVISAIRLLDVSKAELTADHFEWPFV
ncbi:calcium-binding protein [Neogemmobacter tilapiae]|uniref:Calcium-binding protein n=1 Tax=Neogemmobacter tilapiae TaxID=875041 RepID=A0A918TG56_9RHOB|nr:calcium-binding protein [Gemmobacter tilapiae]GHC46178.1 hypothetical protein GCM10007315_04780 [Gemmobacter tilapiae]